MVNTVERLRNRRCLGMGRIQRCKDLQGLCQGHTRYCTSYLALPKSPACARLQTQKDNDPTTVPLTNHFCVCLCACVLACLRACVLACLRVYACVCNAACSCTIELVTVRCLNAEVLTATDERLRDEERAATLTRQLAHPNIYKPYVHFITDDEPPELWSVGPYLPQGAVVFHVSMWLCLRHYASLVCLLRSRCAHYGRTCDVSLCRHALPRLTAGPTGYDFPPRHGRNPDHQHYSCEEHTNNSTSSLSPCFAPLSKLLLPPCTACYLCFGSFGPLLIPFALKMPFPKRHSYTRPVALIIHLSNLFTCLCLVFCVRACLSVCLSALPPLSLARQWLLLQEVLRALEHIHSLDVVHNRINAESVAITETLNVIVTNFQYSRDLHHDGDHRHVHHSMLPSTFVLSCFCVVACLRS